MYITTAGVGRRSRRSRPCRGQGRPSVTSCSCRAPWATTGQRSCWPAGTWPWRRTSHRTRPRCTEWWRSSSQPRRTPAGCATRPAGAWAPCATSWPATPTSPLCSTSRRSPSCPPSPPPASSWGSTRSTWPTRGSSSPWCRQTRRMRPSPRCAPTARVAGRAGRPDPRRTAWHRGPPDLHGRDPHRRHARRRPAPAHLLTAALSEPGHHSVEWVSVRSKMPNVARRADSGMMGKMSASFHWGSMVDQS